MKREAWFVLAIGVAIFAVFSADVVSAGEVDLRVSAPEHRAYYVGIGGTAHYLDGWVSNRADPGNNCTDIAVTAVAKNSSDVALTTQKFALPIHVLNAGNSQFFHLQVYPPTGTDHWDMSVTGASTDAIGLGGMWAWGRTTDAAGRRIYTASFSTGANSISSLIVAGRENANTIDEPDYSDAAFLNSMTDLSHADAAYGPGRTLPMRLVGLRSTALPFLFQQGWATWVPYTPQVVQRFYNRRNGTHFYTADADEAAHVAATLSDVYSYDGPAYRLNTSNPSNMRTLHRFYNKPNGSHFYTVDDAERDYVLTMPSLYSYDGPAFSVSTFQWYSKPVYRFYNRTSGTHFYTADLTEMNRVMTTLAATYNYEGIGYYLAY